MHQAQECTPALDLDPQSLDASGVRQMLNAYSSGHPRASAGLWSQVVGVSLFQCVMAYLVRDMSWGWLFGLGWVISGFANQNLFCAQVITPAFKNCSATLQAAIR